jgi:hypothetical protein
LANAGVPYSNHINRKAGKTPAWSPDQRDLYTQRYFAAKSVNNILKIISSIEIKTLKEIKEKIKLVGRWSETRLARVVDKGLRKRGNTHAG